MERKHFCRRTQRLLALIAIAGFFGFSATTAEAQDYDSTIQQQAMLGHQQAVQMQQIETGIVQQNLQNPQVQQMYQQHLQSGGTMTPEQFAYGYAATGGYSPEGRARFQQNELANQQKEKQAHDGYVDAQRDRGLAQQQMLEQENQISNARGNLLSGTTDYVDPTTGETFNLSHTAPGNSFAETPNSSDSFFRDTQGNFQRNTNNSGYFQNLQEVE